MSKYDKEDNHPSTSESVAGSIIAIIIICFVLLFFGWIIVTSIQSERQFRMQNPTQWVNYQKGVMPYVFGAEIAGDLAQVLAGK